MRKHKLFNICVFSSVALALVAVTGCETLGPNTHRQSSSVVKYLYPKKQGDFEQPSIPVLSLPLKVGIAFVPEDNSGKSIGGASFNRGGAIFSEEQKLALMKSTADAFRKYPFVHSIQLIPSVYLSPAGGFANLDQIRSMFGIDVIALLSYDQIQFRDQGLLSISYLTVVGLYAVPGEKNDTQTMVDAVVYDLASHKLLFRAPGISKIKGSATPVNLSEELRHDSERGFREAAANLVTNLQAQLVVFKDEIKKSPQEYKIQTKPGYTASAVGAFGPAGVLLVGIMGVAGFASCRRRAGQGTAVRRSHTRGSERGLSSPQQLTL